MIKRTVPTPIAINAIFLLLLLLPVIFFSIGRASASTLESYCERQYQNYRFGPLLPVAKKCEKIFERKTQAWISGDYSNY